MKKYLALIICGIISCSESKQSEENFSKESVSPPYDTLAIDSFSTGATSVDVARQIRLSSQKYQDSLLEIRVKLEQDKILKKEAEDKLKAEKTLEEAKKKADELKKEKKKTEAENSSPQSQTTQ